MKSQFKVILTATLLAFFLNLFFGRSFMASLSTWRTLNRLGILNPQAPIVINNREEIHITDTSQAAEVVNAAKSKIAAVFLKTSEGLKQTGMAVNLSSDGSFVTAKETVSQKNQYYIALTDGRIVPVEQISFDAGSGLAFLYSSLQNVPTAEFADSINLQSGEKLIFLGFFGDRPNLLLDTLFVQENMRADQALYAGKVNRKLLTANISQAAPGLLALDQKGLVAGILSGGLLVPADAIKTAAQLYLNTKTIVRSDFEFYYNEISATESKILNSRQGPVVISVLNKTSSLKAGDEVVSVNNQTVGNGVFLEEILEKYKPGDTVNFTVLRQGNNLDLTIKPKELK